MNFINLKFIKNFIDHNLKIFNVDHFENKNKILVKLFNYKPSTIPVSYHSNSLSKIHKADIISYYSSYLNFFQRIRYVLLNEIFNELRYD